MLGCLLKKIVEFAEQALARFRNHDGVRCCFHDQHAGGPRQTWWEPCGGGQMVEIGSQSFPSCSCKALHARAGWQSGDIRGRGSALQKRLQHGGFFGTPNRASHAFKPSPQRTSLPSFGNEASEAGQQHGVCGLGQHGGVQQMRPKGVGDDRPSLRRCVIG